LTPLLTPDQAIAHIRLDSDLVDDAQIQQAIDMATAIVMKHIKLTEFPDEWADDLDASPIVYTVPFDIQAAALLVLGELWQNAEASSADVLSPTVCDLLDGYRDPSMA